MRVLIAAIAMTSILSAAQSTQTKPAPQIPKMIDITVTGCLIQGSEPTVFVLDNSRINPADSKETPKKYLLINAVEDVHFKDLVNHEVTATGGVQMPTDVKPLPPPAEKDLPTLTAHSIASISDRCTAFAGR